MKKAITISIIIAIILALTVSVVVYLCVHENDNKKGPEEDKIYENTSDVAITIEDIEKLTLLDFPETSELKYAMCYVDPNYSTYEYCAVKGYLMLRIDIPFEDSKNFCELLKTNAEKDSPSADTLIYQNTPHPENLKYIDATKRYQNVIRVDCKCSRSCEDTALHYDFHIFDYNNYSTFFISLQEGKFRK